MSQQIGYLIKGIHDKIKYHADADMKAHNLTLSQSRVLAYLAEHGGEAPQKEIAECLEVTHPTVVGIVSRMERSGFLSSRPDPRDKRNNLISLTEKAKAVGDSISVLIDRHERQLLAGFSPEEAKTLERLLLRVYKNVK